MKFNRNISRSIHFPQMVFGASDASDIKISAYYKENPKPLP